MEQGNVSREEEKITNANANGAMRDDTASEVINQQPDYKFNTFDIFYVSSSNLQKKES